MEGYTIADWPSDLLCHEMKGHWSNLYEKSSERYRSTMFIRHHTMWDICRLQTHMWDICHLWTHMWDICHLRMHMWYIPMEKGTIVEVILHYIGMCREWSGTIVMDYACVWLIIHQFVDVVCLLDCYAIYYLRWVLPAWWNLFFYLRLTILKPSLYDHSLSYIHFVFS